MAKFVADTAHSELEFTVKHMMVTKVRGTFGEWSMEVEVDDIEDLSSAVIKGEANVATIDTGVEDRDAHLRSGDFFETDEFPKMTFESTKIEGSGSKYQVTGNLTIKDVTEEETFELSYEGQSKNPLNGATTAGFIANGTVNREKYGVTFNQPLETGGVMIGKDINFQVSLEFALED